MDTSGWITIEQIVNSYLNEKGDYDLDQYERYCQIVIEGITDLNMYYFYKINPFIATVNDIGMIKLPADYIDYARVGRVANGKVEPLGRNNELALPYKTQCGIEVAYENVPDSIEFPVWTDYTQGGGWRYGEFRIDKLKRTITFLHSQMRGTEIYIEYISSGISLTGLTMVDRPMGVVIKEYLNHILTDRSNAPAGEKQRTYYMFGEKLRRYKRSKQKVTASELLDAIRSGYTMGPKR